MATDTKLRKRMNEILVTTSQRGCDWTSVNDIRARLVLAAEEYANRAESASRSLAEAAKRIRETEEFTEPRSATGWCGSFEDLVRLRGEIDALTTALEITTHYEGRNGAKES